VTSPQSGILRHWGRGDLLYRTEKYFLAILGAKKLKNKMKLKIFSPQPHIAVSTVLKSKGVIF
jgi:hypothetical protein